MTQTFLKKVSIQDFDIITNNLKKPHEDLSTYIIANYLFTNLNQRINFFKDINELFDYYLNKYTLEYLNILNITKDYEHFDIFCDILIDNIKLVYKGGNMINYYLNVFKNIWEKINVDIKADTLSDFDFSILINYNYILENLMLEKTDDNYIKLSRVGNLIAFNIIKHFNNYMFCYNSDILKDSYINRTVKFPNTVYYKFADIDNTKIMEFFTYANDYFSDILKGPDKSNLFTFISENIDKINKGELNYDLKLHFDIISKCTKSSIKFVGFSLPTTFNKHKKIFNDLDLIKENNSMKLTKFVLHLINNIKQTGPDTLSDNNTLKNKININRILKHINKRYDRIETKLIEVYPTNDSGHYCNFLPTKLVDLYEHNIKNTNDLLTKYYEKTHALNYYNFYHVYSNKLTLYDDIFYKKFITSNLNLENYSKIYLNKYFSTHENMVSMSSNSSLLFGTTNQAGDWTKITNFNLERGKIPVRYFFKLETPYIIEDNLIEYLFVDYLGELIDISISTYGDSYFREHFISKNFGTNTDFTNKLNEIEITGNPITNKVNIQTYSLEYFIFDLYEAIFVTGKGKPWETKKYEKRIGRVIKSYLVYLKNEYNSTDGLEMYNVFVCYIEKAIEEFKQTNNIRINLISIVEPMDKIFKDFLVRLEKLAKNISQADYTEMINFLNLIICYLKPTPDCISKINHVEDIKPYNFLSESFKTEHLKKFQ
jgi:hypothetical protein